MDLFKGLWSSMLLMNFCSGLIPPTTDGCTRNLNTEKCLFEVYCLNIITDGRINYVNNYVNNHYGINHYDNNHYDENQDNIDDEYHRDNSHSCYSTTTLIENPYTRYYLIHMKFKKNQYISLSSTSESFGIPESTDHAIYELIYHLDLTNNDFTVFPVLKSMPKLFSLDLSKNSLTIAKLSNVYPLIGLRELNLSYNTINTIEKDGETFTTLNTLNLSHNYLVAIPDAIFDDFPQLTTLDLSHNFIDVLGILTFEGLKDLYTLLLSHNRLTEINDALVRFSHLETLDLSHNRLKYIKFRDFDKLHEMKYLNLSHNSILSVEENVFHNMVALQLISLNNNSLQDIGQMSFANNTNLEHVDISKNNFKSLPRNMFKGKSIQYFDLSENYLEDSLTKGTFEGLTRIVKLDLSNQQLTAIEDFAFSGLDMLDNLLLNNNKLQTLSHKSFKNLKSLTMLDLSANLISNLSFDTSDLINLRLFLLHNNIITQIPNDYFQGLITLHFLDLSNNEITNLGSNSYISLRELVNFDVSGNSLNGTLEASTFEGLVSLPVLHISFSKLTVVQNETFTGMTNLRALNVSHGNLIELQYNAFIGIRGVEIIDISYNNLTTLEINVTDLVNLKELFLRHNLLRVLNGNAFIALISLTRLDLSHNNIESIQEEAFDNLRDLRYLDISYNSNMDLNVSAICHSKEFEELNLSGLRREIKFMTVSETSVSKLDLSNSSITNITTLDLKMLMNLRNLILSHNTVQRLEVGAFSKNVEVLDLSFNQITFVQPGVFKNVTYLRFLNVSHNFLTTISYGVFSRLFYLETLDLSYNNLKSLETQRFYEVRSLRELIVDYNNIDFISNEEFAGTSLVTLSIGGNSIPCGIISSFKKQRMSYEITALNKDESFSENVAGITCVNEDYHKPKRNTSISHDSNEVLSDIRDILSKIALKNITHGRFDNINGNNYSNYFDNITREIGMLSNLYNNTLSTLTHSNHEESSNTTNELLVKILKTLNRMNPVIAPISKTTNNVTQFDYLIRYVNSVKQELEDTISAEKNNILAEVVKKMNFTTTPIILTTSTHRAIPEKIFSDESKKVVTENRGTTFTDICVGLILLILVCFVLYKFYKSRMFVHARRSYSTRELPGAMESPDL